MKVGTLRKANILCIFGGKDKHFTPPLCVKAMLIFNVVVLKLFDWYPKRDVFTNETIKKYCQC